MRDMRAWKIAAAAAVIGTLGASAPTSSYAQSNCAFVQPAAGRAGSTPGRYYQLVNRCQFNVTFRFNAGTFGRGVRDHAPFVAAGRTVRMFVPNPQFHRYSVTRAR